MHSSYIKMDGAAHERYLVDRTKTTFSKLQLVRESVCSCKYSSQIKDRCFLTLWICKFLEELMGI